MQSHYENELGEAKRERVELMAQMQELASKNERLKVESGRQLSSYKSKYQEYKNKLRKANENIATLLTRLAKFDIQLKAAIEERQDGKAPRKPDSVGSGGGVNGVNKSDLMQRNSASG